MAAGPAAKAGGLVLFHPAAGPEAFSGRWSEWRAPAEVAAAGEPQATPQRDPAKAKQAWQQGAKEVREAAADERA
jgi:hypothetical protein